jgi:hypothetical protein
VGGRARRCRRELDAKHEIADVDLVTFADDGRLRDLAPVDVRTVGAFEVGDDEAPVTEQEPGMSLGDVALGKHEVVSLHASHVDLVLVEDLAAFAASFFADNDREHAR